MNAAEKTLDALARKPDDDELRKKAERIFARIESRPPDATSARLLSDHALTWAAAGFSARAREVFRRWKVERKTKDVARAEAIFLVCTDPAAASARLRALALSDPRTAALFVVSAVNRGQLASALEVAARHDWFEDGAFHARKYALWALVLSGREEEAELVVRTGTKTSWLERCRNEAFVASYRCAYAREHRALEEALSIAEDEDLGLERAHIEVALATCEIRSGELAVGKRRIAKWPAGQTSDVALDRWRDMVRLDLAILTGDNDAAEPLVARVLRFAERTNAPLLACHLRFCAVLVAHPSMFTAALTAYRQDVHRLQIPYHVARLRLVEGLVTDRRLRTLRGVRIAVRTRAGESEQVLARLWTPTIDTVGNDLYWDKARELIWLRGEGPFFLGEHPMLLRLLAAVLDAPGFSLPFADVYAAVWGGAPYHPLAHDGKINVALHRLRRWFDERLEGSSLMILVENSTVRMAPERSPAVVSIVRGEPVAARESISDRVFTCVEAEGEISPAELEARLGCSRATIHRALRALIGQGLLRRTGAGRKVVIRPAGRRTRR